MAGSLSIKKFASAEAGPTVLKDHISLVNSFFLRARHWRGMESNILDDQKGIGEFVQ